MEGGEVPSRQIRHGRALFMPVRRSTASRERLGGDLVPKPLPNPIEAGGRLDGMAGAVNCLDQDNAKGKEHVGEWGHTSYKIYSISVHHEN